MTGPDRRTLLGFGAALAMGGFVPPASAALPPADAARVAEIERYLDGVQTLRAGFEQLAPDGGRARGRVHLQRPGKMRFDYDPPSEILLIATDWRLIFQDSSVQQLNVVPVSETPLGFLLTEKVKLSGDVTVTQLAERNDEVALQLIRTGAEDQGNIVIFFAAKPLALRRWTVTDPQGLATQIVLTGLETNVELGRDVFRWRDPTFFGWPEK